MSARDVIARAVLDSIGLPHIPSEQGTGNADAILSALHDMPAADRLALARALVPEGYVVAKDVGDIDVEYMGTAGATHGHGWNACRAAMLAAAQENDDAT